MSKVHKRVLMTLDSFGATADYAWANIMVAVFIMVSL